MKKVIVQLVILFIPLLSIAQMRKEVGLLFNNPIGIATETPFEQFGVSLKLGSDKGLWRMNLERARINSFADQRDNHKVSGSNVSFNFAFGREWREKTTRDFSFTYGVDFLIGFGGSRSLSEDKMFVNQSNDLRLSYGAGAFLGVNYDLGDHFVFGLKYRPELIYSFFKSERTTGSEEIETTTAETVRKTLNFNLVNNNVLFSASYKF